MVRLDYNIVANILPTDHPTPPDPRDGVNRSKLNFFRNGHVAYQIKENREYSNMVGNVLPAETPTPTDPGDGVNRSKLNFFGTWSCCISN